MKLIAVTLSFVIAGQAAGQDYRPVGDEGYRMLSELFTYDASVPLGSRTLARFDTITFVREKFIFNGWQGSRVPGLLAVPKTNQARHPVILLIDGIGGWKERWWQTSSWNRGRILIDSLIAGGYAVAMIDAFASGERTHENDYETAETFVTKFPQFRDLALQNTIEHRRLLDYLGTRNDIDTSRIGSLGLSLGGMTTFYLAALEPRVKVAVAGLTPLQRIPDVLWPGHYAPHTRIPTLMLMGRTDAFYTTVQVERVFTAVASSQKQLVWYETGHRLPAEYAGAAVAWFRKYLR